MDLKEARVSGLHVAYRQAGSGPPLVLLHGGMEDSRAWHRQLDALSDEYTVLAWDAPGCGGSTDVPETWRLRDFADALAGFLHTVDAKRPHVLGLSWGSSIALEFYSRYPHLPASLILVSAYAGWAGSLLPEEVAARHASILAAAEVPPEALSEGWPGLFGPEPAPDMIAHVMRMAADNSGLVHPGGYRAMAHSMAEADLRHVLPEIRVPTLLMYGALDQRSPLHVAEALHQGIPGAELAVLQDVGHLPNLEAPDGFNARLRQFLRATA